MPDREKVLGHLYDCLLASKPENMWVFARKDIVGDALELLKKQEPIEPIYQERSEEYVCQKCGQIIWKDDGYCSKCGQKVKWK